MLAVQPATAFSELGHSGKHYVPQVMDDACTPGATWVYKDQPGTSNDELDRIVIHLVDGDAGDPGACAPRYPQG